MSDFGKVEAEIGEAMLADQYRLRCSLRTLRDRQKRGKPCDREFNRLVGQLTRSVDRRKARAAASGHRIIPVGCWAHARRKFEPLIEAGRHPQAAGS